MLLGPLKGGKLEKKNNQGASVDVHVHVIACWISAKVYLCYIYLYIYIYVYTHKIHTIYILFSLVLR